MALKNVKKIKVLEIERKAHFFFKNEQKYEKGILVFKRICKFLFFRSFSNIYMCLLDGSNKCIIAKTTGACNVGSSKKQKKSIQNLNVIMDSLLPYLKAYKITHLEYVFRCRITRFLSNIINYFLQHNISLYSICKYLYQPHNGVRKRNHRRI